MIRSREGSYHSSVTWDNESSNVISVRQSVSDAIATTSVNDCGVAFVASIDSDNYLISSGRIHSSKSPETSHGCIYFGQRLDPDFGLKSPGFPSIKASVGITDVFLAPTNRKQEVCELMICLSSHLGSIFKIGIHSPARIST